MFLLNLSLFLSIDGTHSTGFGRMINDATLPDANCKIMIFSGCTVGPQAGVHLCVFAIKTIEPGSELRYDYGMKDLLWRKKV